MYELGSLSTAVPISTAYPIEWSALNIGWPNIVTICVVGSGWFLVAMDQWQRTCATRSTQRTKLGMAWYFGLIAGFAVVFGLIGIYDKVAILPSLTPHLLAQSSKGDNPLIDLLLVSSLPNSSQFLYALFALGLLAAAMSTANTFLIVSGHSFVSDLLLAVAKNASLHSISEAETRVFLGIARGAIVVMGIFVILTWTVLYAFGLLTEPLSFFFIAYSIQFALLAPMVWSRLPPRFIPSGAAVFHAIRTGIVVSLLSGLGFWYCSHEGVGPILGIAASDWLALTPVLVLISGTLVILGFQAWERGNVQ